MATACYDGVHVFSSECFSKGLKWVKSITYLRYMHRIINSPAKGMPNDTTVLKASDRQQCHNKQHHIASCDEHGYNA